jgi:hypothetical protein
MVTGRAAIGAMWKNIAGQATDPRIVSLDVKPLGPSAARETYSLRKNDPPSEELTGKYRLFGKRWEMTGNLRQTFGTTASRTGGNDRANNFRVLDMPGENLVFRNE